MMYMTEAEKDSKQTTENWNAEADRILLFVRALSSIFYITPSKAYSQRLVFFPLSLHPLLLQAIRTYPPIPAIRLMRSLLKF